MSPGVPNPQPNLVVTRKARGWDHMDYLGGLNTHGETSWKLMMRGTKAAATRKTGHNKRGRVMNAGVRVYKRILKLDPRH